MPKKKAKGYKPKQVHDLEDKAWVAECHAYGYKACYDDLCKLVMAYTGRWGADGSPLPAPEELRAAADAFEEKALEIDQALSNHLKKVQAGRKMAHG